MNFAFNDLTISVTGKESISDCNAYELKQLVSHFPFFGPAHLLLAKKMKEEELSGADQQIQKASLYFSNPIWFDHLLGSTDIISEPETQTRPDEAIHTIHAEMEIPTTYEEVVVQNIKPEQTKSISETEISKEKTNEEEIVREIETGDAPKFSETEVTSQESMEENAPPLPTLKIVPVSESANMELSFEPYHTVDYFASQGIRAKEEDKPKDKFSQQLRSFTEWLKTMKRVPAAETAAKVNPNEEKKVEQMAEVSITDREVVTEAMAEVWEKQGNHDKAAAIYQKLSLLDPSKSSYFAAKIDQLKHS